MLRAGRVEGETLAVLPVTDPGGDDGEEVVSEIKKKF